MVRIYFEAYDEISFRTTQRGGDAADCFSQATVQDAPVLERARINWHGAFYKVVADLYQIDADMFTHGTGQVFSDSLDVGVMFPDCHLLLLQQRSGSTAVVLPVM
jgi:hypothetical protein